MLCRCMKWSLFWAALAVIVTTLSSSLSAQWPLHQAPGVPKGPDGKPDLSAPAPRTADGKPDLSGIWMSRAFGPSVPGRPPIANFGHAGIGFKEDLDDPKAYTRPFTVRIDQRLIADGSELIEYICHENQQFLKKVRVD